MTVAQLQDVLSELSIQNEDWDALIVGDGSGTGWKESCGWASVLIDHYGNYRFPFWGGWSVGTSHISEIMPYIQALTWYASGPGKVRLSDLGKDGSPGAAVRVHIVSDNANVVNQGNRACERSTYPWLWSLIDGIEREGFLIKWHWMRRNRLALNKLVDVLSRSCRLAMKDAQEHVEKGIGMSLDAMLYGFNPEEPNA